MIGKLNERSRREDVHLRAGPRGFRTAGLRADQAETERTRGDRCRKNARDRRERSVQSELAEDGKPGERVGRHCANRRHKPERNRQIEVTAFLRQIRRRHVDGDAFRRQREPGRYQCGAHALLRFGHRFVRKSDEIERGQPGRHLDLHVNGPRLHAFKGDRRNVLNHAPLQQGGYRTSCIASITSVEREMTISHCPSAH